MLTDTDSPFKRERFIIFHSECGHEASYTTVRESEIESLKRKRCPKCEEWISEKDEY